MSDEQRCSGCYNSFSGWWCDNCDQWPCVCNDPETVGVEPDPEQQRIGDASAALRTAEPR
jgi:hypothetical protein